jgi:hypothetical protein
MPMPRPSSRAGTSSAPSGHCSKGFGSIAADGASPKIQGEESLWSVP